MAMDQAVKMGGWVDAHTIPLYANTGDAHGQEGSPQTQRVKATNKRLRL